MNECILETIDINMGKLLSKLQHVFGPIEMVPSKLLMVGLESAGNEFVAPRALKIDLHDNYLK